MALADAFAPPIAAASKCLRLIHLQLRVLAVVESDGSNQMAIAGPTGKPTQKTSRTTMATSLCARYLVALQSIEKSSRR